MATDAEQADGWTRGAPADPAPDRPAPRLHVVLYRPEIAANTGSIGRTCVAVGAKLWLVRPLGFHLGERHRRRAGLDYWDHLTWQAVDDYREVAASGEVGRLWLFSTKGDRPYTEPSYRPGDALVFGSESQGLPASILGAHPDSVVRIPMRPEARSLNLAVAVAVATFEAIRQTDAPESPWPVEGAFRVDAPDPAAEATRDPERA